MLSGNTNLLDPTFGDAGIVNTTVDGILVADGAAAYQASTPDGKIVIANTIAEYQLVGYETVEHGEDPIPIFDWNYDMLVARYNDDGSIDESFATNGFARIAFGPMSNEFAWDVAIDSQGRIVVVGQEGTSSDVDMAIVRLTSEGAIDFQRSIETTHNARAQGVDIDELDRIVIAGQIGLSSGGTDLAVARLHESGELDFVQTIDFGLHDSGFDVKVDSQQRIVAVGTSNGSSSSNLGKYIAVRLTNSGALDTSFGLANDGKFSSDVPGPPFGGASSHNASVAIDSLDRVLIGGTKFQGLINSGGSGDDFTITRLTSSGNLDLSFGVAGQETLDFGSNDEAYSITVDELGRIIIAGFTQVLNPTNEGDWADAAIARLTPSGTLDETFGKQTIDFNDGSDDRALGVIIDPEARIVVAGVVAWPWQLALARLTDSNQEPTPVSDPNELGSVISELPPGTTVVDVASTPANLVQFIEVITELPANNSGQVIDIVIELEEGDYQENGVIDVPAGYRVIINGSSGHAIFHGSSPSFIVESGEVLVTGVTFVNSTNSSTILVNGGSISVRNSWIVETTGGAHSAIEVTGGSLDLGTLANPGGNTLIVSGSGEFVRNRASHDIPVFGNTFQAGSATIASDFVVQPGKRLVFDEASGGVILQSSTLMIEVDVRPSSLNINQNGAISLVLFGSSLFDVTEVDIDSLRLTGVAIDVFNESFVDANHDNSIDLVVHFRTSAALKTALTDLYADQLLADNADDATYSNRQQMTLALDGAFGEFGQEFEGTDAINLFLAGNSLRTLLESLGI